MIKNKLFWFLNSLSESALLIVMAYIRLNGKCSHALHMCYLDIQIMHSYLITEKDYPFIEDFFNRVCEKEEQKIAA